MSEGVKTAEEKAAEARRGPAAAPASGAATMAVGMPAEKSQNFGPSAKRLLGLLRPERPSLYAVLALAVVQRRPDGDGPQDPGAGDRPHLRRRGRQPAAGDRDQRAGGRRPPRARAGHLRRHASPDALPRARARASTSARSAGCCCSCWPSTPWRAVLSWAQGWILTGAVNRTIFNLRRDVEDKLNRLPLPYFDAQPRGELLSRVTNDIDNVAQSLQQTLSQLLTSLLTVVAMVAMMLYISPLLALIALVTIPVSMVVTATIGKRSQKHFVQQWKSTGELNAIVEETFTGHELVKVFGRQDEVRGGVPRQERRPVRRGLRRAVHQRHHHADDDVHREPQLRRHRRRRWAAGGQRRDEPRRRAGVHPVLAPVHPAADPGRVDGEPAPVRRRLRRARVRGARRARAAAGDGRRRTSCDDPHGRVEFEDVSFSYAPDNPLIEDLDLVVEPGQTVAIVGPTGAGKTTLVNLIMRFYELDAGRITLDGVDITDLTRHDLRSRDRHGPAGHLAVRRHDPREHRLRRPGASEAEVLEAARATYVDRFVHSLPRRLRHGPRRRGRQHQRRREAAHHHRAGVPLRPGAAHPRRGDQLGRHPHRAARPAGDGGAAPATARAS